LDGRESRLARPGQVDVRAPARDGRPAFGIGPIARVPTATAVGRAGLAMGPGRSAIAPVPVMGGDRSAAPARVGQAPGIGADNARARAFGLPNLRRNVCPHFYMTGARGAIPIHAPHLLKALVRQDNTTSRCQLRGGVHMEQSYVNDVCLSPRFNQCVFYEEDLTGR
jgi:hypothetical protein